MVEKNPFSDTYDASQDEVLIREAISGQQEALNGLINRHNNFIFNIAIRMLGSMEDAKDVTQEILIKVITNLSAFDPTKAQFRTWLYRISFNYILNYKQSFLEKRILSFDQFYDYVADIEDDPAIGTEEEDTLDPLGTESMIKCMNGVLMCIPREDRLLYILGDLFRIDHKLGSEIFSISKDNFRQKLSRIRKDLRSWMDNKCGLINKDNPCRCRKKTKGFIERGVVNPENLNWDKNYQQKIQAYSQDKLHDTLRSSDEIYSSIYRTQPFKENQTAKAIMDKILSDKNFREILDF